jgi:hypothetical protein
MAYLGKNPKFDSVIVKDIDLTTPENPAAGSHKIINRDGSLYLRDSSGVESPIGSGGSGGINYIDNPDAEVSATGWAVYADAAGVAPVDGTGGTANVTIARSTSSPLRGAASFLFSKDAANRQGQGTSYDFTIDSADVSKTLQISLDIAAGTNYVAGDMRVYVYDVTNAVLISPASVAISAASYTLQTTFVASTSTSYRLILHVSSTNASAYTLKFDNVQVGPQLLALGTAMESAKPITLTYENFGTVTGSVFSYERVGNLMHLRGKFTSGTTVAAAAAIVLPSGFTIDSTATSASLNNLGMLIGVSAGASQNFSGLRSQLFCDNTNLTKIFMAAAGASGAMTKQNGSSVFNANGDTAVVDAWIPIAEWAGSSVYLSQAQPEYAYNSSVTDADDSSSFAYGPQGGQFGNFTANRTKRVRFLTPIQATDKIVTEISSNAGVTWQALGVDADTIEAYTSENATLYGCLVTPVTGSNTDLNVAFMQYRRKNGVTYGSAGANYAAIDNDTNFRWRVVKVPGQVQVASPVIPTATSMSDVSATALGLKEYFHGTTYNGGIAPTVSGTGFTIRRAVFIPYQMQSGSWRMKFAMNYTQTSSSLSTATVNGVVWKISTDLRTAISASQDTASTTLLSGQVIRHNNTNTILAQFNAAVTDVSLSGDVELESKPTWAY